MKVPVEWDGQGMKSAWPFIESNFLYLLGTGVSDMTADFRTEIRSSDSDI
jgi:hypothetical protein